MASSHTHTHTWCWFWPDSVALAHKLWCGHCCCCWQLLVAQRTCDKATGMLPATATAMAKTLPTDREKCRERERERKGRRPSRKYRMSPDVELCAPLSCDFGHGYDSGVVCLLTMPCCCLLLSGATHVAFVQLRCQLNVNRICDYNNLLATLKPTAPLATLMPSLGNANYILWACICHTLYKKVLQPMQAFDFY